MLTTIGVILVATVAVAVLEIWLFWRLDEREARRRSQGRTPDRPGGERAMPFARRSFAKTRVAPTERPMRMGKGPPGGAPTFVAGDRRAPPALASLQRLGDSV